MEFNKKETQTTTKQVVNHTYPPVIISGTFAAGSGVIQAGTPVAKDANKKYIPYDAQAEGSASSVVGVVTKDVDTDAEGGAVGAVIRMGMVHAEALTDNSPETLEALAAEKIFA